jgi:hypothetical protein
VDLWPAIPNDIVEWFRRAFAHANARVTERLLNVPNIRETALDDGLIEALIPQSAPRLLPSGAVVEMNIHNIGGLRRLHQWETADIAIIVFVYRRGQLLAQKIGLLQSKRLYPANNEVQDSDPLGFQYGMNQFLRRDPKSVLGRLHRQYDFNKNCTYGALTAGDPQINSIRQVNETLGEAVYYLFYNPSSIPMCVRYPVSSYQSVSEPPLGCRVYKTDDVDAVLKKLKKGKPPSIGALERLPPESNWRLETWAADLLLTCKVGQLFGPDREQVVSSLLERRSGPIGAAIAISIEVGETG